MQGRGGYQRTDTVRAKQSPLAPDTETQREYHVQDCGLTRAIARKEKKEMKYKVTLTGEARPGTAWQGTARRGEDRGATYTRTFLKGKT